MFELSPRVTAFGLHGPPGFIYGGRIGDGIPTYGLVLSVLAVAGLLAAWRRRSAWLLALLWLGCAVMALGPVIRVGNHIFVPDATTLDGVRVSAVMPYTWFVRIPGLSGFREPARILMLGMVPAALLAGAAVNWLRYHAAPAIVVVLALGVLEAGWSGNPGIGSIATSCRPSTGRSPPTIPGHSWLISRTASGAELAPTVTSSIRRRRCWRPPTGTRARWASCPGYRPRP